MRYLGFSPDIVKFLPWFLWFELLHVWNRNNRGWGLVGGFPIYHFDISGQCPSLPNSLQLVIIWATSGPYISKHLCTIAHVFCFCCCFFFLEVWLLLTSAWMLLSSITGTCVFIWSLTKWRCKCFCCMIFAFYNFLGKLGRVGDPLKLSTLRCLPVF